MNEETMEMTICDMCGKTMTLRGCFFSCPYCEDCEKRVFQGHFSPVGQNAQKILPNRLDSVSR